MIIRKYSNYNTLWWVGYFLLMVGRIKMKKSRLVALIMIIALTSSTLQACLPQTWLMGTVQSKDYDGKIGSGIFGAKLQFIESSTGTTYQVTTDANGNYSQKLEPGCYWIQVMHTDYEDYSSIPTCTDVFSNKTSTANFTLRLPVKTTVLLVRHSESTNDDDLTQEGLIRRDKLAQDLWKSGITAIYSTKFTRTLKTVQGLANMLHLPVIQENDINILMKSILEEHRGDTVLVASHSGSFEMPAPPSIPDLMKALGAGFRFPCTGTVSEYDNLYVVTKVPSSSSEAHVINLQYGAPQGSSTQPDSVSCPYQQAVTIVFLVVLPDDFNAVPEKAVALEHALHKAELASIWIPEGDNLARSMAKLLPQVELHSYPPGQPWSLFHDFSGKTSLVLAGQDDLPAILEGMQIDPMPLLVRQEFDNLFMILNTGIPQKLLNLQYGNPSP
jgi:hypothetical protein